MIDLHFHALPGLDDGPATMEESAALCRRAAEEGTTHVVATPHVLREPWLNEDPAARAALLAELNGRLGGSPAVLPGCELMFSFDILELVEKGAEGPVVGLNGGRFLLVEFAPGFVPKGSADLLRELAFAGHVPVVAHPERNLVFGRNPGRLVELVERGAVVQVTAASLLGDFGRTIQEVSCRFFEDGLVHLVASDAHSIGARPPRMEAARAWVRRTWGDEAETSLFERNPEAVVGGRPLPWMG